MLLFERMPELFLRALRVSDTPSFIQLVHFVVSASALLPFTLLIGATFPCAVAVAARGAARVGRDVGETYAINTLGAIVGSIAAGFALVPAFGVNASIRIGIATNLILAGVLFAPVLLPAVRRRIASGWWWGPVVAALAAAGAVFLLPAWDQRVMSSGPAIYGKRYIKDAEQSSLAGVLREQRLLFYRDGRSGTVSVNQVGDHIILKVNGKADASTSGDMPTQLMSGHLPMLLHRDPQRVLVIGMGSGITAGAVLHHPVERLDIVEIERAVLEASHFFAPIHGGVLQDHRVRAIVADGRNFLLTTPERYDVIVSEPSNPWIGGLASLFSVEFFQLARAHLRPGGLMVQWIQGYNLFPADMQMVVNTFRTVFPSVTIWNPTAGDFLLLGSAAPVTLDLRALKDRYQTRPRVVRDLERLGLPGWAGLLGYFVLGDQDSASFAAGAGVNTDDRLPLEFSAPRALYRDTVDTNWRLLRSYQTSELPPVTAESQPELEQAATWYSMATSSLKRGALEDALARFERVLQLEPGHTGALVGATSLLLAAEPAGGGHLRLSRFARALHLAREAVKREPRNADALYLAGLAAQRLNLPREAVAFLDRAVAANPDNAEFQAARLRALGLPLQ